MKLTSKKILLILVISLVFLFSNGKLISAAGIPTVSAETPRVVRVGIYENKPKIYRNEKGQVVGLYGDILSYIAEKENWQIVYVDGSFDEGLNRLKTGQIDIMVDVAFSMERVKEYDFNQEAVFNSWGVIYAKKSSDIKSFKDLDKKKIAILKSSIYRTGSNSIDKYINAFDLNTEFLEKDQYSQVFDSLSKGEVDAAIVSQISGATFIEMYPDLKATDIIFSPTELRFALTKDDFDTSFLVERLDYWIKQIHDGYQGVYQQILEKNGLSNLVGKITVMPGWVYPIIIVGIIVLFISIFFTIGFGRARDISLRLLSKKEWYLNKVVGNMPIILLALDKNGAVIFSRGKALQALGINSDEIEGQSELKLFSKNEIIIKNIEKVWLGEKVIFEVEIKGKVYKTMAYPMIQNGKVEEVALISIDVTEENLLDRAKKEFISIVQHQLRTPPTIIKWGFELLNPKLKSFLNKEEQKSWKMINDANERMVNLANIISRISEMESGLFRKKLEVFDLPKLTEEIINELRVPIKNRKIKVYTSYDGVKKILMDKTIIDIIIQALISNAVYYTSEEGYIKIYTIDNNKSWLFKVEDNGFGVPEDMKGKMFTPFTRGDEAFKYYPEGLGIGLYTAQILLSNVGGKIWYESEMGKGSTFYVEIPKKQ